MQPRTRRQREVLDYITKFMTERGYEPSYQQIARHLKITSKATVSKHIAALEKLGILSRRRADGSFNLQLKSRSSADEAVSHVEWLELPGVQTFSEAWEHEPLFVPNFMLGYLEAEKMRGFRVPDESMIDEQICEGDIALVEKRTFARDGAIIVAALPDRVTLKQFFRDGAFVELRPANVNFQIIRMAADKVTIVGIFRGLLRPAS